MIQANELRIGNWITIANENRPPYSYYVEAWDIEKIETCGEDCFGIPLTSEILEKAGFNRELSSDDEERQLWAYQVANNTSLYYDKDHTEKKWYLSYEWDNNHFMNDFWACPEYLHTLQNLVFALTSEELDIKL